jgi:hypothetical protein
MRHGCHPVIWTSEAAQPTHLTSNAKEHTMAKSQKRSNREVRKPKAEKSKKQNASNPSQKPGALGIVTLKSW